MTFSRVLPIFCLFPFMFFTPSALGFERDQSGGSNPRKQERSAATRDDKPDSGILSGVTRNIQKRVERARELLSDVGLSAPPLVESLQKHHQQVQNQIGQSPFGIAEASPSPVSPLPVSFPPSSGSRDPFAPTPLMQQEARRQGVGPVFIPSPGGSQSVPNLRLRGFVTGNGNQPVALLEVAGQQVFLVREGDTISLQNGGQNSVLKVKKITQLSALVEIGTLGQVIVVR